MKPGSLVRVKWCQNSEEDEIAPRDCVLLLVYDDKKQIRYYAKNYSRLGHIDTRWSFVFHNNRVIIVWRDSLIEV